MFRDDNNRLVPIILDRIHFYYTMLCEENEPFIPYEKPNDRDEIKAKLLDFKNARPLSNFQHQNKYNEV